MSSLLEKIKTGLQETGNGEGTGIVYQCHQDNNAYIPCDICGGSGYVYLDSGEENLVLHKCNNNQKGDEDSITKFVKGKAGISHAADKTFDSFDTEPGYPIYHSGHFESLASALDICKEFAEEPSGWIYIYGTFGTGKTHLAYAIANYVLSNRRINAMFVVVPEFLETMRDTYSSKDSRSVFTVLEEAKTCDLLFLDDLGAEAHTDWAGDKIFQLLDYRYSRRMPTVITSNLGIRATPSRVASRISDKAITKKIVIEAPDYRGKESIEEDEYYSQFFEMYTNQRFENTNLDKYITFDTIQKLYDYASDPGLWVCFLGVNGAGKTHLAASVAHHAKEKGVDVIFTSVPALDSKLKSVLGDKKKSSQAIEIIISRHKHCGLLVLEDMEESNRLGDWVSRNLNTIIEYRYMNKLPTVFTAYKIQRLKGKITYMLNDKSVCQIIQLPDISYPERNGGVI